jgi:hypothetical protein
VPRSFSTRSSLSTSIVLSEPSPAAFSSHSRIQPIVVAYKEAAPCKFTGFGKAVAVTGGSAMIMTLYGRAKCRKCDHETNPEKAWIEEKRQIIGWLYLTVWHEIKGGLISASRFITQCSTILRYHILRSLYLDQGSSWLNI